jgi:integrase
MTPNSSQSPATSPFVRKDQMMLSHAIEALDHVSDLSSSRRRDLKSALRTLARLIGSPVDTLPANINWLHIRLRRLHPAQQGISKKRFLNIKSDALKALELTVASRERKDWLQPPSPAWQALLDHTPKKQDAWKLTQLAQYCSALGIEPQAVSDAHVLGIRTALIEESFQNKPEAVVANAVKTWNRLKDTVEGWPQVPLSPPPRARAPWTIPLDAFPESFQRDVGRWTARLAAADLLDDDGPAKPLRPKTIAHRKFQIREVASALVHSGFPREEITDLSVLVDLTNLKAALRWMMTRFGGRPTEAIKGVAVCLQAIARHHVKASAKDIDHIRGIVARLGRDVDGLREKNRQRLLQLEDPANMAKLLTLPGALVGKAEPLLNAGTPHCARKGALLMQAALAIEILLNAPMRIGNLCTLDLSRHLRRLRVGREQRVHIHIPPQEVKNAKALDYELGAEATALLDLYVARARPVLMNIPTRALFPAQDGASKRPDALSRLIKDMILEHTGLVIHPHLFRSIAGKIHSLVQPGDVATLAHVLNDTMATALRSYAQFERRSALAHYQESLAQVRGRRAS